jgi:hypothetical protein
MSADTDDFHIWNDELSDREIFFIGKIIAQWGALEHEVFVQTLMSFDAPHGEEVTLPGAMNNLQFTDVLKLWKERVADKTDGKRGEVLQQQYERILNLKDYRDALVHGMWEWSTGELTKITAVRIRKKEIISVQFTADDLENFYSRVGNINFKLRSPGGIEEFAQKMAEVGSYASRRWLSVMTGDTFADEWLGQKKKKSGNHDA